MLSSQEEKRDRIETIENDRLVREAEQQRILREGTTLHQFAQEETLPRGRFDAPVPAPHIVGSTAIPKYPQASAPFQTDPVGDEPPLPVHENSTLEEPSTFHAYVEATGPASADAPSLSDLASLSDAQRAGAGPSFSQAETMAARGMSQMSVPSGEDDAVRLARPPVSTDDDNGTT